MPTPSSYAGPRLVYLHIPKTSGTSIRETIKTVYGEEATHWYTQRPVRILPQLRRLRYKPRQVRGKVFLGGHQPLKFYPKGDRNLYCATMREPAERVKSLFSYYTRPAAAIGERDLKVRKALLQHWLDKGIDPDSLVRSIEDCAPFRAAIANQQCAYISRGKNTFQAVKECLQAGNFLIGNADEPALLFTKLATLFHWPETPKIVGNVSKAGENDDILTEPGALEIISEYCDEDQKLYEYVTQECQGLYFGLNDSSLFGDTPLDCGPASNREISGLGWKKVTLRIPSTTTLQVSSDCEVKVIVTNKSREYLNPDLGQGIFFAYKLLDAQGVNIPYECVRTRLENSIAPGEEASQLVKIQIPKALEEQVTSIRLGMLDAGKYWVESICKEHPLTIAINRQAEYTLASTPETGEHPGHTH